MKIVTVVGARPQFVKAAAVSRVLRGRDGVREVLVHTGQHFDANMSEIFFRQMDIPKPDYNLEIAGLSHGAMTGRMIEKIEEVLIDEKPDVTLVYGDTNSTLAAALAAAKLHVPVAHVEAGLRSFNMKMPEEINRILTDRISNWLFCPTDAAVENLRREGFMDFGNAEVVRTGDVMQDAAMFYAEKCRKPELTTCPVDFDRPFALVTIHRAENTDEPDRLRGIFNALGQISREMQVVMPLHPRTGQKMQQDGIEPIRGDMFIVDPVGYLEMIYLLKRCRIVLTDSGGLQKEAFFFKKPCVTLREETEWVELVEAGANVLAGSDERRIVQEFRKIADVGVSDPENLYGGGRAGEKIVDKLLTAQVSIAHKDS